jgi:GNAT superfamily N-acetyltransferase
MTAITAPLPVSVPQLRPLNIVRDLPGVADLVEKCFADTMDTEGRNYIQQMRHAGQDNSFLRWASRAVETVAMPLSGYIWEENREIIGNVSLIPYRHARKKYYLIANVAVRPEWRKRGIGRALTIAAMQLAKHRHADETWLHVRDDNPGAIGIYHSLGFVELARRTTWQAQPDRNVHSGSPGAIVTRRVAHDWPAQETWLRRLYPDLLAWYQAMPWNSLRPGLVPALYRFLSDDEVHHWVARAPSGKRNYPAGTRTSKAHTNGRPCAVASWQAMVGRNNRLWVAVPPEGSDDILTELLLQVRHKSFQREKTSLDFPAGQYSASIEAAGFHPTRTLLWMKSDETSLDEKRKSI